jgi:hypothetical protein
MHEVIITTKKQLLMDQVLIYCYYELCKEGKKSEIHDFKKERYYVIRECLEVEPIYKLSLEEGEKKVIDYDRKVTIWKQKIGEQTLYKIYGNHSFENVYHLHIEAENRKDVDDLFEKSVIYYETKVERPLKRNIFFYNMEEYHWQIYQEANMRDMETIFLPEKEKILNDIDLFLEETTYKRYTMFGIPYRRTYFFHGLPGSGKTSFIQAIASKYGYNICMFQYDKTMTEKDLFHCFKLLPSQSMIVIEQVDLIVRSNDQQMNLGIWLDMLDGILSKHKLLVFLTSNHPEKIESIYRRPGRVDVELEFSQVSLKQLKSMMTCYFPTQVGKVSELYDKMKDYKLTVCYIQKYFFEKYAEGGKELVESMEYFLKKHNLMEEKYKTSMYI